MEPVTRINQVIALIGALALFLVWAFVSRDGWLLVEAAEVALTAVAMEVVRRWLPGQSPARAVTVIAVVSWLALPVPTFITPFIDPIMAVAALVPVAVAVPYVSARRLRVLVLLAGLAAVAAGLAARAGIRWRGGSTLPGWVELTVWATFLPFVVGMVGLISAHNQATIEASRIRLMASTDRARRLIERDLHDGVQQRLTAVALWAAEARELLDSDPGAARLALQRIEAGADVARRELHDLCAGIYPAELTDYGLGAALEAAARRSGRPVTTEIARIGRLPRHLEAAVYFTCAEAMQNALRHGGPGPRIRLHCSVASGQLTFEIVDDGPGFDPHGTNGQGLANMHDRIHAVGGILLVDSKPGRGTQVRGSVALPADRSPCDDHDLQRTHQAPVGRPGP